MTSEQRTEQSEDDNPLRPGDLELDDRLEFGGHDFVVVGTGPAEASLERVDDSTWNLEVFRWAITDAIGIELETTLSQDEFERSVSTERDSDE